MSTVKTNTIENVAGTESVSITKLVAAGDKPNNNLLINGGMDIWQRGTSSVLNGYNTADRWATNTSGATCTVSREDYTHTDIVKYAIRLDATIGSDYTAIWQYIENAKYLRGQPVTISAMINTNTDNMEAGPRFKEETTGTHGGVHSTPLPNTEGVWQYWSQTYTLDSPTFASDLYALRIHFGRDATIDDAPFSIGVTAIKVEVGSIATPYQPRPIGEELALCQRYYQAIEINGNQIIPASRYSAGAGSGYFSLSLPVSMRSLDAMSITIDNDWQADTGYGGKPILRQADTTHISFSTTNTTDANSTLYVKYLGTITAITVDAEL